MNDKDPTLPSPSEDDVYLMAVSPTVPQSPGENVIEGRKEKGGHCHRLFDPQFQFSSLPLTNFDLAEQLTAKRPTIHSHAGPFIESGSHCWGLNPNTQFNDSGF
jgi:hypothetical protein